jgi:hypothetical protein
MIDVSFIGSYFLLSNIQYSDVKNTLWNVDFMPSLHFNSIVSVNIDYR